MSVITRNIGRVSIVPKGIWNNNNTYTRLDLVSYNGNSYIAKQDVPINININNENYWKIIAEKGDTGASISNIRKTQTSADGLTDTYTVYLTNGETTTFQVKNGVGIASITGPNTNGLTDTYTITFEDGRFTTFDVQNAKSIESITELDVTYTPGGKDKYRINYNDGTNFIFEIQNGRDGKGLVSTVDGIQTNGQDVNLLIFGDSAPTTSTAGQLKQRYYDRINKILYICTGIDTTGAQTIYTWQSTGTPVDNELSTTSQNPVQNNIITGKVGNGQLSGFTATDLTSAANELNEKKYEKPSDGIPASDLEDTVRTSLNNVSSILEVIGDGQLSGFTATDLTSAANELNEILTKIDFSNIALADMPNTDLNEYTDGGAWYFTTSVTPIHKPEDSPDWGFLIVLRGSTISRIIQFWITTGRNDAIYFRTNATEPVSWEAWESISNGTALNDRSGKGMTSIAINNITFKTLFFGSYNILSMVYPDSGAYAPLYVGTSSNPPEIVNDYNATTLNHNLIKAFGTSSSQYGLASERGVNIVADHSYYVAMYIKVPRYVAGDCGIIFGESTGLGKVTLRRTTDTFELLSEIRTATTSQSSSPFYLGTANTANADCYIACPVVIDMTAAGLSNNATNKKNLDIIYKRYIEITAASDFYTRRLEKRKAKLATVIMGQTSGTNRFAAARQLNAIARKKLINPYYSAKSNEYDMVTYGIVAELPESNTAMYEKANFNVLFAVDSYSYVRPMSTVKVLNAITALYYNLNLNEQYTIESGDIISGDTTSYRAGDVMTIKDLLYAMFLESSNTCANALGTLVGRKILHNSSADNTTARTRFMSTMSERLKELGGSGWSGSASGYGYETAVLHSRDLLKILIEAVSFPEILRIWNKKTYTVKISGTNARNVNIETTVADEYYEKEYYIIGGKTGTGTGGPYNVVLISEPLVAAI